MFAVIRHYRFDPKNGAEIDRLVREEFMPLLRKTKGFKDYYWLDTGKGEGASFSLYEDKEGADESIRLAEEFGRSRMAKLMTLEVIEGQVAAHV